MLTTITETNTTPDGRAYYTTVLLNGDRRVMCGMGTWSEGESLHSLGAAVYRHLTQDPAYIKLENLPANLREEVERILSHPARAHLRERIAAAQGAL